MKSTPDKIPISENATQDLLVHFQCRATVARLNWRLSSHPAMTPQPHQQSFLFPAHSQSLESLALANLLSIQWVSLFWTFSLCAIGTRLSSRIAGCWGSLSSMLSALLIIWECYVHFFEENSQTLFWPFPTGMFRIPILYVITHSLSSNPGSTTS